ncbi:MAG TPA: nuclear transport factor 2 family protein [Blastocatellia bacterium]|nr:nuclear transport factor 2 family protein [Blastocatellia bacterium]
MPDQEAQLNEIEQKLVKAWLDNDWQTVDDLLDNDWSVIDPGGRILTKAQVLDEAKSGQRKIESGGVDEIRIRNFGDFAVVTGRTRATGSYMGNNFSVMLRFTDVFVKREDKWQAVASQGTLLSAA